MHPSEVASTLKSPSQRSIDFGEEPLLRIIHFNDVADIDQNAQSTGVVNFQAHVSRLRAEHPDSLLLFSGNAFSPSSLTNVSQGQQMVAALNYLKIDAACLGNHAFDFEQQHTLSLTKSCKFPWLLGNIRMKDGTLLGEGKQFVVKEVGKVKVGIMGIAGEDWIELLAEEYEGELVFQDELQFANRTAKLLREGGCDVVIALTCMKNESDRHLASRSTGLDLILGGHHHVIVSEFINGTPVLKSGCNFKYTNIATFYGKQKHVAREFRANRYNFGLEILRVPGTAVAPNVELGEYVLKAKQEAEGFDMALGYSEVEIDSSRIGSQEAVYGNFLADLLRLYYDSEVALVSAEVLLSLDPIKAGVLMFSTVTSVIDTRVVVKRVTGKKLLAVLEESVSRAPLRSLFFQAVSGLNFEYSCKEGPRVGKVAIKGEALQLDRFYIVAMTAEVGRGSHGFDVLRNCQYIVNERNSLSLLDLLLKFFRFRGLRAHKGNEQQLEAKREKKKSTAKMNRISALSTGEFELEEGVCLVKIAPKIEGRIIRSNVQ